jgi:hypothetical protein
VINKKKTDIFFSKNTPEQIRGAIQHLWGVHGTSNFEKYLGLPATQRYHYLMGSRYVLLIGFKAGRRNYCLRQGEKF